jgi:5S rRNA maturation endonuclease (ribonuclease M5)
MSAEGRAFAAFRDLCESSGKIIKRTGPNSFLTQCPGPNHKHGDKNPSLSVRAGRGRVLLYCFAGCIFDQIADAIGWPKQDFFDDRDGVTYAYDDGRTVHRKADKSFHQSGHSSNGHATQLLRLSKITEAPLDKIIYLVEGEQDVETIETLGLIATTAPMGALNFGKVDISPLHGRKIIAIADKDDQGAKWAEQVKAKLDGNASIKFRQAKIGKDASDVITATGKLDLEPIPTELSALMRTGDWLDQQEFPELRWIVPGLIPEGFTLLVGAPKIGKSWMALAIALAVSAGGYTLGKIKCEKRPVLLLALEDSDRRMQSRIRKLINDDPIPAGLTYITKIEPKKIYAVIMEFLDAQDFDAQPLVIIDTIGKIIPPAMTGEGPYSRDYRFAGSLQRMPCDLIGLHRDRKAESDDFVATISGTNGLAGAADTPIVINRKRNEAEGVMKITSRDAEEGEYGIKISDGVWTLIGDDLAEATKAAEIRRETKKLGDRSVDVINFLHQHPSGKTPKEVGLALQIPRKEAAVILGRLYDSGKIDKPKLGVYTPKDTVVPVVPDQHNEPPTTETTETTPNRETTGTTHFDREVSDPFAGRCEECRWHIETQGHRADCSRFYGPPKS